MSRQLALGALPYRLTTTQIASFLARHPVVATEIAETESVMHFGLYDYDYNPATQWKLPGVIPPWGEQVQDSQFGLVTIFPARSGEWIYTGGSKVDLGTDKPGYVSPTYPDGVLPTIAGDVVNAIKGIAVPIGIFLLAYAFLSGRGNK